LARGTLPNMCCTLNLTAAAASSNSSSSSRSSSRGSSRSSGQRSACVSRRSCYSVCPACMAVLLQPMSRQHCHRRLCHQPPCGPIPLCDCMQPTRTAASVTHLHWLS
jgi:hypothetical protein